MKYTQRAFLSGTIAETERATAVRSFAFRSIHFGGKTRVCNLQDYNRRIVNPSISRWNRNMEWNV